MEKEMAHLKVELQKEIRDLSEITELQAKAYRLRVMYEKQKTA